MALQSKQLRGFNSFSAIIFLQESPSLQKQDKIQHSGLIFFIFYFTTGDWMIYSLDIQKTPRRVWQTFLKRTKKNNVCLHLHALFLNSIWETSLLILGWFKTSQDCEPALVVSLFKLLFLIYSQDKLWWVVTGTPTQKLHKSRLKRLTSTTRKTIKYCAALLNVSFLTNTFGFGLCFFWELNQGH